MRLHVPDLWMVHTIESQFDKKICHFSHRIKRLVKKQSDKTKEKHVQKHGRRESFSAAFYRNIADDDVVVRRSDWTDVTEVAFSCHSHLVGYLYPP